MRTPTIIFIIFLILLLPIFLVNTNGSPSESNWFGYKPQFVWNTTWENNESGGCVKISISNGGNVYVIGGTLGSSPSVLLIKYTPKGDEVWNRTWKNNGWSQGWGIVLDSSEKIYVCAQTDINSALIVYNSSGYFQWSKSWTGTVGSLTLTNDSIYLVGVTTTDDTFTRKYNLSGNFMWEKSWDSGEYDSLNSIFASSDNKTLFATGITGPKYGAKNILTIAYDLNGTLLWNKTWGGSNEDAGTAIASDGQNNVFVAGYTDSYGGGNNDILLVKYDKDGNFKWYKTWGNTDAQFGFAITLDGSYAYITGWTHQTSSTLQDCFLLKTNLDGIEIWNRTWGSGINDRGGAIDVAGSYIYIVGLTGYGAGGNDVCVLKYDLNGNLQWDKTWGGTKYDIGLGIAVDSSNIYAVGETYSFVSDDGFILITDLDGGGGPPVPEIYDILSILPLASIILIAISSQRKSFMKH